MKKKYQILIILLLLFIGYILLRNILFIKVIDKKEVINLNEFEQLAKNTRKEFGHVKLNNEIEMNTTFSFEIYKIANNFLVKNNIKHGHPFAMLKFSKVDDLYIVIFKSSPEEQAQFINIQKVLVNYNNKSAQFFPM
jgi:hypothetical protein